MSQIKFSIIKVLIIELLYSYYINVMYLWLFCTSIHLCMSIIQHVYLNPCLEFKYIYHSIKNLFIFDVSGNCPFSKIQKFTVEFASYRSKYLPFNQKLKWLQKSPHFLLTPLQMRYVCTPRGHLILSDHELFNCRTCPSWRLKLSGVSQRKVIEVLCRQERVNISLIYFYTDILYTLEKPSFWGVWEVWHPKFVKKPLRFDQK